MNNLIEKSTQNKWWQGWRLLASCLLIGIIAGVSQGQDANWDLKNYHYYVPHAWLNDRYDVDIAPAQLQTWHSPFADLPYYWMAKANVHSVVSTAVLSLTAGISIFLLLLVARVISPSHSSGVCGAMLILLAVTGAAGARTIGTTMSEWHLSALWLAAILCMLKSVGDTRLLSKYFLLAGVLGGSAVGLKLTAAPFAIGLAAMCLFLPGTLSIRLQRLGVLGLGGLVGFLLFFAPWALDQYQRYGNPLFPYFNDVFKSPLVAESNFRDAKFAAKTAFDALKLPFLLVKNSQWLVSEPTMRDPRLLLGFFAAIYLCWRNTKTKAVNQYILISLSVFFVVSYVVWVFFFGIYRYVVPLELLAGLFILAALTGWQPRYLVTSLVLSTFLVIGAAKTPSWGRVAHGESAVIATIPPLPSNTIVVIASLHPLAYVVPSFPSEIRTISVLNNFMWLDKKTALQQSALSLLRLHTGDLYRLMDTNQKEERHFNGMLIDDMLSQMGFLTLQDDCLPITSNMQPQGLALCKLVLK
jgi:hypothetical protein